MKTTWSLGIWEMMSPLEMMSAAIWDPPGLGGRKKEDTWDIRLFIRAKSFNAPTSAIGWCMESHTKWG
jgi:hypothetical protein